MYKLFYFLKAEKHSIEASTIDEILSMAIYMFDQNAELSEIKKDEETLYKFGEIYNLIKRCYY